MGSVLIMFIVYGALIIILQILLSKMKNKWFGLILPSISFVYSTSLSLVLNITPLQQSDNMKSLMDFVSTFLVNNIPTFILLAIHFSIRKKRNISSQIEKMKIRDL
ncbi:hypothetical protein [Facklamia miroungae]|uniref:Uncharacterized protein n=1 Tax=Facklamia miroungae TaxID=120956 RepID=A0A1G7NY20_9LACT|nr:hypothetical protein [Facklamia miroungae]NKZ28483.1 hypothetical protein [Facklamia miroungae]SDF78100.1 hypothetical protein SAMN05421791_10122 [Facklamia miroungae]